MPMPDLLLLHRRTVTTIALFVNQPASALSKLNKIRLRKAQLSVNCRRNRFAIAVSLAGCGTFEAMCVRIKSSENMIPQSRSVMNLAFGLGNFSVRFDINLWKALPLVDKILSFMWTSVCTIVLYYRHTELIFCTLRSVTPRHPKKWVITRNLLPRYYCPTG